MQVDINEVYIFKLDSPITSQRDDLLLSLTIELLQIDGQSHKVIGTYNATINGQITH